MLKLLAAAVVAPLLLTQPATQPLAPPARPPAAPAIELVSSTELVTAQRGDLPIILSAPHGGAVRVHGSKDRARGVTVRDVNTAEIALICAQRLTDRLRAKPYFVIAQFSRKDADANRDAAEAYENDAAKTQCDAYHRALKTAVDECRARFGAAILIDLHGQVREPDALVRGTRNGKTVTALVARHGAAALTGPDSIFGRLRAAGYRVIPDGDEPGTPAGREMFFDGGYIVANYGSDQPNGVDAIQIEIGSQRSNNLIKVSRDIAEAVAACARVYYLKQMAPMQDEP